RQSQHPRGPAGGKPRPVPGGVARPLPQSAHDLLDRTGPCVWRFRMKKLLPLLLLTAAPALAHPPVSSPSLSFLPPEGQVVDMLTQDPNVRRADALLNAAQAEARAREAGPHEFTLHGEYVTRATNLDGRLNE